MNQRPSLQAVRSGTPAPFARLRRGWARCGWRWCWRWCWYCWLAATVLGPLPLAAHPRPAQFGFAEPYFEAIDNPERVPGGVVAALLQDQRGLLWVGTQNGLVRYDGYAVRRFVHAAADPFSPDR